MTNYEEKFEKFFNEIYVTGQRNNKLIDVVREAKKCGLDKIDVKNKIKACHKSNEWHSVEKDFENCWEHKTKDTVSYDEYFKNNTFQQEQELILNQNFNNFIESYNKINKQEIDITDSSLLKYFFKRNDWIYIVSNQFDDCSTASDANDLIDKEIPLKRFQFMSFNTYKNGDGKRNQENLKEMRYILLESDSLPLDKQLKFFYSLIEFKIPVKSIIYSGSKSFHCLIKIHPMNNLQEYKKYCEEIYSVINELAFSKNNKTLIDIANKDGIRYTRSPFGYRQDKEKIQKMIYCDMIEADNETYEFEDVLQQFKKYVSNFIDSKNSPNEIMKHFIGEKCNLDYAINKSECDIEDIFLNNTNIYVKIKNYDLQKISKNDLFDLCKPYLKQDVIKLILPLKDSKHQFIELKDFYIPIKDIKFEVNLNKRPEIYNLYKPGFIVECLNKNVTEMPSEFDKLLNNLANKEEKDWLINHLACHFNLIKNNFKKDGRDFVLETIPVFYGKSGTGKNTLLDVIGQAISDEGTRYISIGNIGDDFNEYYLAGAINVNEAANGRSERRASKEALKRFTDKYQKINMKFMQKISILNTAYKSISANESEFGVLDIDKFDRRYQYICGGTQLNGKENNLLNMELFEKQKYDFISYLLNYKCDFDKAMSVFDNEAKIEDKINSLSNIEQIVYNIKENIDQYPYEVFTFESLINWYESYFHEKINCNTRMFGKILSKYLTYDRVKAGKDILFGPYTIKRLQWYYKLK